MVPLRKITLIDSPAETRIVPSMLEDPAEQRRQSFERRRRVYREIALMEMTLAAACAEQLAAIANKAVPVHPRSEFVSELVGGVPQ